MLRRDILRAGGTLAGLVGLGAASASLVTPAAANAAGTSGRLHGGYVETRDGVRLRVRDWGQGAPIVFLNAWALPSAFWDAQFIDASAAGFRAIGYDRRGHGRSDEPGFGYDADTLADDLEAVLNALDVREATLVAYSMSSGEAARYMTRHGAKGRVARIVFVSAITPYLTLTDDNPGAVPAAYLETAGRTMAADYPKWLKDGEAAFWLDFCSAAFREWARGLVLQTSVPAAYTCQRMMTTTDFRPDLKAIRVPTLVLHGDKDTSAPLAITGKRTADLVAGAEFKVIEGAPHGLPHTHRARFMEALFGFMKR